MSVVGRSFHNANRAALIGRPISPGTERLTGGQDGGSFSVRRDDAVVPQRSSHSFGRGEDCERLARSREPIRLAGVELLERYYDELDVTAAGVSGDLGYVVGAEHSSTSVVVSQSPQSRAGLR
jgi:hypothetical protein